MAMGQKLVVRVYDRENGPTTKAFKEELRMILYHRFEFHDLADPSASEKYPLIVICREDNRLEDDFRYSLSGINVEHYPKTILVYLHAKKLKNLPEDSFSNKQAFAHEKFRKLGEIVDVSFSNGKLNTRFGTNLNDKSLKKIEEFLEDKSPTIEEQGGKQERHSNVFFKDFRQISVFCDGCPENCTHADCSKGILERLQMFLNDETTFTLLKDMDDVNKSVDKGILLLITLNQHLRTYAGHITDNGYSVVAAISIGEKTDDEEDIKPFNAASKLLLNGQREIKVIQVHVKRKKNNKDVVTYKFVTQIKELIAKELEETKGYDKYCCLM